MGGAAHRVFRRFLPASVVPFVLSLSKDCSSLYASHQEQGFDKLSPNGGVTWSNLPYRRIPLCRTH
jgi:hypothetical protein